MGFLHPDPLNLLSLRPKSFPADPSKEGREVENTLLKYKRSDENSVDEHMAATWTVW